MHVTGLIKASKTPLSQAPGKTKLRVAIPGALVATSFWSLDVFSGIAKTFAIGLLAYAIVGFVEILFGESLVGAARKWDQLAGWKKLLMSLVLVLCTLALFMALMPLLAQWLYGV